MGTELQAQNSETQEEKSICFKQKISSTRTLVEKAILKPEALASLGREGKLLWLSPTEGHLMLGKRRYDQITDRKPILSRVPELKVRIVGLRQLKATDMVRKETPAPQNPVPW